MVVHVPGNKRAHQVRDVLTVDERAIEPLNIIVLGEGEEDLITDDWERKQEDGPSRHRQGEGAQVQSEIIKKKKQKHNCYFEGEKTFSFPCFEIKKHFGTSTHLFQTLH